jgi:hypothetical protein
MLAMPPAGRAPDLLADIFSVTVPLTPRRAGSQNGGGNRIQLIATQPDFEVALTGFDRRRDLVVRVARKGNDAPEAELY